MADHFRIDSGEQLFRANCQMAREAVERATAEIAPSKSVHLQEAIRLLDLLEVWGRTLAAEAAAAQKESFDV